MTGRLRPGDPFNPYGWWDGIYTPNWLYPRNELSFGARMLYSRLVRFTAKGGECRPSQEYLARDFRISIRQVQRLLDELERNKLIRVSSRGLNQPNVYEFLWHEWMEDEGIWHRHDDETSPPDTTDVSGPDTTDVSCPSSYEQERVTKRSTRSRAPRRERQPFRTVSPDENLPDEDAPRRARMDREDRPASRTPRAGSGTGLAQHFIQTAIKTWGFSKMGPDPFNERVLASKLTGWKRDGVTEEEIRAMIDLFALEPLPAGKPPWVSFLAARTRLLEQARRVSRERRPAAERYTTGYLDEDD